MNNLQCYINGEFVPLENAKIGVYDLGVLRGFGIYEGITAFSGEPFHFDDHWERFLRSAELLGLQIPATSDEVRDAMRALVKNNTTGLRAIIRMVLTGGEAEGGLEHVPGRETLYIVTEQFVPFPAVLYEQGGHLISHDHQRFMPGAKTIGYITAVMLQSKRKASKAIEILYTHGDRVLECATSNIFIVHGGIVITPETDVLKGITRNVTIDLAREAYTVEERSVTIEELLAADEVFMTSSFKDIMPIVSLDEHTLGNGAPGPVTKDLMRRFAEHTHGYHFTPHTQTSIHI
jgi:branched-chain amino acid aminotransferase